MVEVYKNATCLPCTGSENKPLHKGAKGGVFDQKGRPISDAFLVRYYRRVPKIENGRWDRESGQQLATHKLIEPGRISGKAEKLSGKFIFAGYLFPHFGHFLLESLANYWFFKQHPDTPIIWMGVHNQPELNDVNKAFIELLDIKNPIHIITRETKVEELLVPKPGYIIHTRYTKAQQQALKVVDAPTPKPGKKVWLSRSKLPDGIITNERSLEKLLEQQGWTIYHPEDHPMIDQLTMIKDAEVLAGCEGSAFHMLMLIPEFKGKVKILARRPLIEFDYIAIATELGLDQETYTFNSHAWSHDLPHWRHLRFWVSLTPALRALEANRPSVSPRLPQNNIGTLCKRLSTEFNSTLALELWPSADTVSMGLSHIHTFLVSPNIEFDVDKLPKTTLAFEITPDQFFTGGLVQKWPDLICIRTHDDEQELVRAFNNSLLVVPRNAIWVIEYQDTLPSQQKDEGDKIAHANAKLVHYIDKCFPMLSLARVQGHNAVVVWQHPRMMLRPKVSSFADLGNQSEFERAPSVDLTTLINTIKNPDEQNPT